MVSSLTSDRDYLELLLRGDFSMDANVTPPSDTDGVFPQTVLDPGLAYGTSALIIHNIGTIPIVRAWYDSDKNGRLYNTPRHTTGGYLAIAQRPQIMTISTTTTTKILSISPVSETSIPVHYRIYRFGTKGVTSDENIDKIFGKGVHSQAIGGAADSFSPVTASTTIAHGQGEQILWKLQFSVDQSTWYNEGAYLFGAADTSTGPPGGPYTNFYYETAYASADATNFYVVYVHNYPTTRTIYTRWVWEYK